MFLGGTDGWIGLPAPGDPTFHPDPWAGEQGHRSDDVHLRVPQRHRARRDQPVRPEGARTAQRAAVLGGRDDATRTEFIVDITNLGLADAARPVRCAHAALARFPQRDPVLRRRAHGFGVGACRHGVPLRLSPARPGHLHVPLPRRRRRARAHGHERSRVRPPGAELRPRRASISTTTRPPIRPRVRVPPVGDVGRVALGRCPHPAARSGATTRPTSPC